MRLHAVISREWKIKSWISHISYSILPYSFIKTYINLTIRSISVSLSLAQISVMK